MRKEAVATAKTIEQAVEIGAKELGMNPDDVTYEVLELPKKGILGFGAADAKVKVFGRMSNSDIAVGFIEKIIGHMKINAMPKIIEETKNEIKIDIIGDNLGTLIGYHGEILDSLQYLTYLAVNKDDDFDSESGGGSEPDSKFEAGGPREKSGAVKISLDIENYRKKREETLQTLAKKMADRVLKYGRSVTLEPMNAYERRIIHSTIQDIAGVNTHSVGQENDRKIVISRDGPPPVRTGFQQRRPRPQYGDRKPYSDRSSYNDRNSGGGNNKNFRKP